MQKKSLIFFILKLIKMPLTILTLALTAKYFGVGIDKDVWLLALGAVTMIDLAIWGPVNETFRSRFVLMKETEGEEKSFKDVQSLLFYIFIFSILLTVFLELFPHLLARLIAPSYNEEDLLKLVTMIRILAPFLLVNQFILISTSILNAYEKFYIPEIASFVSQIINLILIVFFADILGINSLAIALYISSFLLIGFLIYQFKKEKINLFQQSFPNFSGFRKFFFYAIPFFIPYFIGQISGTIERTLATELGKGVVSIVDFSRKIPEMLNGILITVVLTILVPVLTKAFANKEESKYEAEFLSSYKLGLFGLVAFITFFINGSDPILNLLYSSKSISENDMSSIILLSKFFAISLLGVYSYIVFGMSMLSVDKGKLYAGYGSMAQILLIVINFTLIKKVGIIIFPISYFISHFIAAIFMYSNYPYDKKPILKTFFKYIIFGTACVIISSYLFHSIPKIHFNTAFSQQIYSICISICISILILAFFGYIFRIGELMKFYSLIKNKLKRNKNA